MLLEGIIWAEAENEESEMAFVVGEGVIRPTDCNHKMIFNGLFHRNRNTPNSSEREKIMPFQDHTPANCDSSIC